MSDQKGVELFSRRFIRLGNRRAAQVILRDGTALRDVRPAVEAIVEQELAGIHNLSQRLARDVVPVC